MQRATACVHRFGVEHILAVIVLSNMYRWPFKLFDKAASLVSRYVFVGSTVLLVIAVVVPVTALAQEGAPGSSQNTQSSNSFSGSPVRKNGDGFLGVYLGDINEDRAKELKLVEVRGAVVGKVEEGSPAAAAGLQENDVILGFNDQKVYNPAQIYRFLTDSAPGDTARLAISRSGVSQNVVVKLGQRRAAQLDEMQRLFGDADAMLTTAEERARQAEEAKQRGDEKEAARLREEEKDFRRGSENYRAAVEQDLKEGRIQIYSPRRMGYSVMAARYQLGVHVTELTEQLAKFFNAKNGVLVTEITAGGIAEVAGIKAGDCIAAVNGDPVITPADLNRLVDRNSGAKDPTEVALTIIRDRNEQIIKVRFNQR